MARLTRVSKGRRTTVIDRRSAWGINKAAVRAATVLPTSERTAALAAACFQPPSCLQTSRRANEESCVGASGEPRNFFTRAGVQHRSLSGVLLRREGPLFITRLHWPAIPGQSVRFCVWPAVAQRAVQ